MKHNQNVLCVDILFEKKNYIKQFTAQERKTFHEIFWFKRNQCTSTKVVPRAARTKILTYPNFKGRGYRPKPERFRFEFHADRNRFFHCARGWGILEAWNRGVEIPDTYFCYPSVWIHKWLVTNNVDKSLKDTDRDCNAVMVFRIGFGLRGLGAFANLAIPTGPNFGNNIFDWRFLCEQRGGWYRPIQGLGIDIHVLL